MHPSMSRTRTGYLLTTLAAAVWASTSPGLKFLLVRYNVPPLTLAFWRDAFIALACVGALALLRPGLLRASRSELRGYAAIGAISIGIYHALWVWSIELNGVAVAVVLIFLFPAFVTLGSWLLFREPLRWPQLAALAVSVCGCALLVRAYDPAVVRVSWLGIVVGLLTAITHSGYVLFSQRSVESRSPWTSLTYTMLFGSLVLFGLLLAQIGWQHTGGTIPEISPLSAGTSVIPWLVLLAVALGPTLGGYAIFTISLQFIPGRIASLIAVIEAPIATLMAVALFGERLEWPQVIGIACILGATALPTLLERSIRPQLATVEAAAAVE